jgi:hypothetical protein
MMTFDGREQRRAAVSDQFTDICLFIEEKSDDGFVAQGRSFV